MSNFKKYNSDNLSVQDYYNLNESDKIAICQELNMYNDRHLQIFKQVEKRFIELYGDQDGIELVKCGMAPMLGPLNCIKVFIPRGKKPVKVPEYFDGFPIFKIYESHYKSYNDIKM